MVPARMMTALLGSLLPTTPRQRTEPLPMTTTLPLGLLLPTTETRCYLGCKRPTTTPVMRSRQWPC